MFKTNRLPDYTSEATSDFDREVDFFDELISRSRSLRIEAQTVREQCRKLREEAEAERAQKFSKKDRERRFARNEFADFVNL